MIDQEPSEQDLERTDVLPQIGRPPENLSSDDDEPLTRPTQLMQHGVTPFGKAAHTQSANGKVSAMPARPSSTELAVGGIRGKIADLETRLTEAQDHQTKLKLQCEQLLKRCRVAEERARDAESNYVQQSSQLKQLSQGATEAQQRLQEERVRFQSQLVETERQIIDARARGEKRVAALELLLKEQSEAMARDGRAVSETSVELEKARAELRVAETSIQSLEERLAKQTQAAAEVTQLYSQQTAQVAAHSELMANVEKQLAIAVADQQKQLDQIAKLEADLKNANNAISSLKEEIAQKLRHIAAIESGLDNRDHSIESLNSLLAQKIAENETVSAAKAASDQRCVQLEKAVADATGGATTAEQEVARLTAALRSNDQRINELAASLRETERNLGERNSALAASIANAQESEKKYALAAEQADSMRLQLLDKENQVATLQSQLDARTSELNIALEASKSSLTQQSVAANQANRLAADLDNLRQVLERTLTERNQLETENQYGRTELSEMRTRYKEAVETIVAARESISVRDQRVATLERELRASVLQFDEANQRLERAAKATEDLRVELSQRDSRIANLEQQCADHADALNAINHDIDRVSSANPSERLQAHGYTLEALDESGAVHLITRTTTTLGRADSNDIAINSTSVSRYHARIVIQPEGVWLIDLQSTNGCTVNGHRISRQVIYDGDALSIGKCKFRFTARNAIDNSLGESISSLDDALLITGTHSGEGAPPPEKRH
jgi:chromosome segregation ATPase